MTNLLIFIIGFILFIASIFVGTIMYKKDYGKKYNFLNHYPFELKTNFNIKLLNTFRASLFGSIIILLISVFLIFHNNPDGSFASKSCSYMLILDGILLVTLFIIPFYYYKSHLICSIGVMVLNFAVCIIMGFNCLNNKGINNLYCFSIIYFILGIIVYILMILPLLKSWYKSGIDEKTQERNKVIPYALIEWINIGIFILIIIICLIRNFVY